jgi:hypothetical protein
MLELLLVGLWFEVGILDEFQGLVMRTQHISGLAKSCVWWSVMSKAGAAMPARTATLRVPLTRIK